MEITGRLIMVLPLQQGTGKSGTPWQKQEFIIETIEQYPKKICANLWGDKTDALQRLQIGTVVKMSFSLESREFNGKWYTDVRAWKLELADAIPAGYGQPAAPQGYAGYPPQQPAYGQMPQQNYGQMQQGYPTAAPQQYAQPVYPQQVPQTAPQQPIPAAYPTEAPVQAAPFEAYNSLPDNNLGGGEIDNDDLPF